MMTKSQEGFKSDKSLSAMPQRLNSLNSNSGDEIVALKRQASKRTNTLRDRQKHEKTLKLLESEDSSQILDLVYREFFSKIPKRPSSKGPKFSEKDILSPKSSSQISQNQQTEEFKLAEISSPTNQVIKIEGDLSPKKNDAFKIEDRNMSFVCQNDSKPNPSRRVSDHIRNAITKLRTRLDMDDGLNKDMDLKQQDDEALEAQDPLTQDWSQGLSQQDDLARLIEATYQYIYDVEDLRIQRRINKIEKLFLTNPLTFSSETAAAQLFKLKKLKQNEEMLRGNILNLKEAMAAKKRLKEFTDHIIQKHNIDISKPVKLTNGEKHVMTCSEVPNSYLSYLENRFFCQTREKNRTQYDEAKQTIQHILRQVNSKEELKKLGTYIEQYMPFKMQRQFLYRASSYIKVDQSDPAVYKQVERNMFSCNSSSLRFSSAGNNTNQASLPQIQTPQHHSSHTKVSSSRISPSAHGTSSVLSADKSCQLLNTQLPKLQSLDQQKKQYVPSSASEVNLKINTHTTEMNCMSMGSQRSNKSIRTQNRSQQRRSMSNKSPTSLASASQQKQVTMYNMQYILQQVKDPDDVANIRQIIINYAEQELQGMHRINDQLAGTLDRESKLRELIQKTKSLDNMAFWEKKAYVPEYRRNKSNEKKKFANADSVQKQLKLHNLEPTLMAKELEQIKQLKATRQKFKRLHLEQTVQNYEGDNIEEEHINSRNKHVRVTFENVHSESNNQNLGCAKSPLNSSQQDWMNRSPSSKASKRSPERSDVSKNPIMKMVVKKLAREMIKKAVPKKVFDDCADIINRAFNVDTEKQEKHQKTLRRMNSRKVINQGSTSNLSKSFNPQGMSSFKSLYHTNTESNSMFSQLGHTLPSPSCESALSHQQYLKQCGASLELLQLTPNPHLEGFLPLIAAQGKSRVDRTVQNRSHQLINKMAEISGTSPEFAESIRDQRRPKFKQTLQDLTVDCDFRRLIEIQKQKAATKQQRSSSHTLQPSMSSTWQEISEDKQKLHSLIKLCMNADYVKELDDEEEQQMRRNKVTFQCINAKKKKKQLLTTANEFRFDTSKVAFRKQAQKALNQDSVMFKKIDLHYCVEKMRTQANKEIFDFFEGVDPNTDSKNLKLLYFYFVGSRNLVSEMQEEAVSTYQYDQMQPIPRDLRRAIEGGLIRRTKK